MGSHLRVRGGSGIGDNLYTQAIVRELVKRGERLEVCTDYPELFPYDVKFNEFSRLNIDILTHYSRRRRERTSQFEDVQIESKVKADLLIDWTLKTDITKDLPRPLLFVNGGRVPMNRKDGFADALLPRGLVLNRVLSILREKYFTVFCGKGDRLYPMDVDLDLNNKVSLTEMMDIASVSDAFLGQVSFVAPLAECFNKKLMCVWSSAGLKSDNWVISSITPKKIFYRESSKYVIDDWDSERVEREVLEFRGS